MTDEQLQFAISQYADGSLPADEVAALEEQLAADGGARHLLEEYRRLNSLLREALPAPEMNWDQFARQISAAVSAASAASMPVQEQPASYRLPWAWGWKSVAMAASVLLCAALAIVVLRQTPQNGPTESAAPVEIAALPNTADTPRDFTEVQVLVAESPVGEATSEVRIGPSQMAKGADITEFYPEMSSVRTASVAIAGSPSPLRDDDAGILQ
jgi:negative regulator of sigma E activity